MIEHSKKMKMKNPELLKLLLKIGREMKNYDRCNEKFQYTSYIENIPYPPINIDNDPPIPWNNSESLKLTFGKSTRLTQEYPDVTCLFANKRIYSIEQNLDISNCSLIAALINGNKFKPEYYPKIKKIT